MAQTPGGGQRPSSRSGFGASNHEDGINVRVLVPDQARAETFGASHGDDKSPNRSLDISQQLQPSGKKVSIATLKRRQKVLEDAQKT